MLLPLPMLKLSPLFGNDAVLQCEQPLPVWGTAQPNAAVLVRFAEHSAATTSDSTGAWRVRLPALPPGGPCTLSVKSGDDSLEYCGIMLGEVWLCSGQSNMEWTLGMVQGCDLDAASASDPLLRCFTVQRSHTLTPAATLQGRWRSADPVAARDFSATAYGFARRIRAETGRAVGIVVAAFGGNLGQDFEDQRRRKIDGHEVRASGHVGDGRMAGQSFDLGFLRVDREHGVTALGERADRFVAKLLPIRRGAQHHD